uniref:GRF-type domain-containing protein n=1 Tax=Hordeum vulgare subsp. vulgare TaxID=112509 RepID=A0A8I6XTG4_HORVV
MLSSKTTTMGLSKSQSSSQPHPSHHTVNQAPPLPLIRCPECNVGYISWFVSATAENPGRHFYKCGRHGYDGCSFWKWENKYLQYFSARWGYMLSHASMCPHVTLLEENQAWLKKVFILGVANLVLMAMICLQKL